MFAAFAQDNIPLGTNYLLHAVGATFSLNPAMRIETMLYHYRQKTDAVEAAGAKDWQDRARINFVFGF